MKIFTSESVLPGHPDKICDQISDLILDEALLYDKHSRVAIETMIKGTDCYVCGELTCNKKLFLSDLIEDHLFQLTGLKYAIHLNLTPQSENIKNGLQLEMGAGDQGTVYGFACKETEHLMPYSVGIANDCAFILNKIPYLGPDGKCQVTYDYDNHRIKTLIISIQHQMELQEARQKVLDVFTPMLKARQNELPEILINPAGDFKIGGSIADCGLTGRKLMVDTYGGYARHGGGAFSGKDPTKVDRSGAYMARYIAKYLVHNDFINNCEVAISYAIGVAKPIMLNVTGCLNKPETRSSINQDYLDWINKFVNNNFDCRPEAIIERFRLNQPDKWSYVDTACYGHFGGRHFPWEQVNSL